MRLFISRCFICNGDKYSVQLLSDAIEKQSPEPCGHAIVDKPGQSDLERERISSLDATPAQENLGIDFVGWQESIMVETIPALLKLEQKLAQK